ncbi:MAG TPA: tetratricopeptide repeat protein [Patescibacteria group bacterium]|nr:tetratricopeptide repeat protein [Patescibacteria group bacterium]
MKQRDQSKRTGEESGSAPGIQRPPGPVVIVYLALLTVHAFPLLVGVPKLWGTDQWQYLPGWIAFSLLVFGLLVLVTEFRAALIRAARGAGRALRIAWLARNAYAGYTVLLAVSAALFWIFRNATHLLGDGDLWANHLLKEIAFNEPVSSWLYREVYRLLMGLVPSAAISTVTSAAVLSVTAGLVFMVYAARTARLLANGGDGHGLVLIVLLSTGMMLLFFGYVETYPPLAAAIMAFTFYGLSFTWGRAAAWKPIVAFAVAVVLHFSAIALLPGLGVLLWTGGGRTIDRGRYYRLLSAIVVVGLAVLWSLQRWGAFGNFFFEKFLPLFPGPPRNRIAYPLFSWKTLFDSFNQIMFVCPMALFLLVGFVRPSRPHDGLTRRAILFLETTAIFYLLEFLVFNKNIGVSRDWDLFAAMAIPLAMLVTLLLLTRYPRSTQALSVIAFAVLAVHTVPLVGIHAGKNASERRFLDLVHTGYWSSYAKGYGYSTLGFYYVRSGDRERGLELNEMAVQADPKNPRYWYNVATMYYQDKRFDEAVELYKKVIDHDPEQLEARNNLGVVYADMGRTDLAEREFSSILNSDSTYLQCYEPLSYIYFQTGQLDKCRRLYRKASELGHDMTPFLKEMTRVHREDADIERSIHILEMMLENVQTDPELYFSAAKLYRRHGDHERALDYFGHALRLAPNSRDFNLEYALELYFMGRRDKALGYLLRLYEQDPGDIRITNNIGVIYSEGGEHEKAVTFFERAVQVHPGNASLRVNLARTYVELGDYGSAWEQVITAEKLGAPVPPDLLEDLEKVMPRPE